MAKPNNNPMTREEQLRSEVFKNKSPAKKWTIRLGKRFLWIRWQWADRDLWTTDNGKSITRSVAAIDIVTKGDDTVLRIVVWRSMLAFAWL